MDGTIRANITLGLHVAIVLKRTKKPVKLQQELSNAY